MEDDELNEIIEFQKDKGVRMLTLEPQRIRMLAVAL